MDHQTSMNSLLSAAVQNRRLHEVQYMLENGASADSTNQNGKRVLAIAVKNHDLDMMNLLLRFNANVNYVEPRSEISILQCALLERFDEAAKLLVERGADINYATFCGLTALHIALERKDEEMVLHLLKRGADPNVKPKILHIELAAKRLRYDVDGIQLCRGVDANGNIDYVTPLLFEVPRRELLARMAKLYLHNDASVNRKWRGPSALQFAAGIEFPELVKLLLDHGADVNQENETDGKCINALYTALTKSDDITASLLLSRGASPDSRNQKGRTPLHLAAEYGCSETANLLINRGVSVDVEDKEKVIPLHLAAKSNRLEMVDLLISQGANVNACGRVELYTSLHYAVHSDHNCDDVILRLLRAGASVIISQPDHPEQKTSLEVAVRRQKHLRLIKILLDHALEHESEVDLREIFARLMKVSRSWPHLTEWIIGHFAKFLERIPHVFFVRTNTVGFIENFYRECVDELTDMKEHVVYKRLTLYDLFAKTGWRRVSLMRNQALLNALERFDFEAKYPAYEIMLKEHLNEAKILRKQYLYVEESTMKCFGSYPLPIQEILDFIPKDEIAEMYRRTHAEQKK